MKNLHQVTADLYAAVAISVTETDFGGKNDLVERAAIAKRHFTDGFALRLDRAAIPKREGHRGPTQRRDDAIQHPPLH